MNNLDTFEKLTARIQELLETHIKSKSCQGQSEYFKTRLEGEISILQLLCDEIDFNNKIEK